MSTICRPGLKVKRAAIGKQMVVRRAAYGFRQTLAELALQKAHHLADPLQGETPATQFADDCHLSKILRGVQSPMAFPRRDDDATLVPPLQLAERDASQRDYFTGGKTVSAFCTQKCFKHLKYKMFETF